MNYGEIQNPGCITKLQKSSFLLFLEHARFWFPLESLVALSNVKYYRERSSVMSAHEVTSVVIKSSNSRVPGLIRLWRMWGNTCHPKLFLKNNSVFLIINSAQGVICMGNLRHKVSSLSILGSNCWLALPFSNCQLHPWPMKWFLHFNIALQQIRVKHFLSDWKWFWMILAVSRKADSTR